MALLKKLNLLRFEHKKKLLKENKNFRFVWLVNEQILLKWINFRWDFILKNVQNAFFFLGALYFIFSLFLIESTVKFHLMKKQCQSKSLFLNMRSSARSFFVPVEYANKMNLTKIGCCCDFFFFFSFCPASDSLSCSLSPSRSSVVVCLQSQILIYRLKVCALDTWQSHSVQYENWNGIESNWIEWELFAHKSTI